MMRFLWMRTLMGVILSALASGWCAADEPQTPADLYTDLSNIESAFPFPVVTTTLDVGVFMPGNPIGERFRGIVNDNDSRNYPYGDTVHELITTYLTEDGRRYAYAQGPDIEVNACNVVLKFRIEPADAVDFRVTIERIVGPYIALAPAPHYDPNPDEAAPPGPNPPDAIYYDQTTNPSRQFEYQRVGDIITVNVGGRDYQPYFFVLWRVESGAALVKGFVRIKRPPLVGAGIFMLPAIPVAIVYEPPQPVDHNLHNTATYSETISVGTTFSTSLSEEQNSSLKMPTAYSDVMGLQSKMTSLADVASVAGKYGAAIGKALKAFATTLGSASQMQTEGKVNRQDSSLTLQCSNSDVYPTGLYLGPGRGDRLVLRKNAYIAWLFNGEKMVLCLLPGAIKAAPAIQVLRADLENLTKYTSTGPSPGIPTRRPGTGQQHPSDKPGSAPTTQAPVSTATPGASTAPSMQPTQVPGPYQVGPGIVRPPQVLQSGLLQDAIEPLLALDPFVSGGAKATLPATRYVLRDIYEVYPPGEQHTFSYTITQQDKSTNLDYTINAVDCSAGLLGFLGIGVTEDTHVKTVFTHSMSTAATVGKTIATGIDLACSSGSYLIEAYYDRIFGTVALRSDDLPAGEAPVSGTVLSEDGTPAAKEQVLLTVGGLRFFTRADSLGRYAFHSRKIPFGAAGLPVQGVKNLTLRKDTPLKSPNYEIKAIGAPTTRLKHLNPDFKRELPRRNP